MGSAKRLEQAVEKLEAIMQQNVDFASMDGNAGEKTSKLMTENKALKETQKQVKKRLDVLIKNIKSVK